MNSVPPGLPREPGRPRPRIIVLVGLPGSGKSTYLERMRAPALSSDEVRRLLADDPADQSIHYRVFKTMRYLLKHRLELGCPLTYLDATHLTPSERRPYVRMAELYGGEAEAIFFDLPLAVCQERNRRRHRIVPDDALERMAAKLRPPRLEEGFSKVTVVRES